MKNKSTTTILANTIAWLVLVTLNYQPSTAHAQGTAFTYQGRLNDGANPATGTYDIALTLFNAVTGGTVLGPSNVVSGLNVTNGLFTVTPDFGPQFNGLDRWLEIAVRTNGGSTFSLLSPRQKLTPTPYSLYAPQAGTATTAFGVTAEAVGTSGLQSSSVTSDKIADGSITAADVNSASFSNTFWKVNGNAGTAPGTHFLGTTDHIPVEFKVNGARALRLEPTASSSAVNVIGGSAQNSVSPGVEAATIAGGGIGSFPNTITASYATIGGGTFNTVAGGWSAIGGGRDHNVTGNYSTVSGGILNAIQTNADAATISGGDGNLIQSATVWSTIGGGRLNVVQSNNFSATIAGGEKNAVNANASFSSIGGGLLNSAASEYTSVGGGLQNTIQSNSFHTVISGGANNNILSNSWRGTIGGGAGNTVSAPEGTVAGGAFNSALAFSATVGGGGGNAASGAWSTIAGGRDHVLSNADYATIGGGYQNIIQPNAAAATIPGGWMNSAAANFAFAAGRRAKANHAGAFVWADATDADFASTADNLFLIRAGGGVGINKNNPATALDVNGTVTATGFSGTGAGLTSLNAANLTGSVPGASLTSVPAGSLTGTILDGRLSANVALLNASQTFAGVNRFNNSVGIGIAPQSTLHVNGTARIQGVDNWDVNNTEGDFRVGNDTQRFKIGVAISGGGAGDVWMRAQGGTARVFIKTPGGTTFYSNEGQTAGVSLAANGTAWAVISDRNVKKDFAPVDQRTILEKLAALPITQWHYQWESADVTPHIGPMAQDFKAAFYPGTDDKSITTQEADGVALAAIQGLNQKMEEKDARIAALERRLEKLERLVNLEAK